MLANVRFRSVLTLVLVGVLGVGVATVGTAAYVNARYVADDLGDKVLGEASRRIEQHLLRALAVAESESQVAHSLIERGTFEPDDLDALEAYFLEAMRANPSLSYLSVGLATGAYVHVQHTPDGRFRVVKLVPQAGGTRTSFEYDALAEGGRDDYRETPADPRTPPFERPYYRWAAEAGEPLWTDSYIFLRDIPGVTRATPVMRDGSLVGVLTADFDMIGLSQYLRREAIGKEGFAFIVELRRDGSRRVLAHPDAVAEDPQARLALTRPTGQEGEREALSADDVDDGRVRSLMAQIEGTPDFGDVTRVNLEADGTTYLGDFLRIGETGDPAWVLCTLIPEQEILGGVHKTMRTTAVVGLAGVVVAVLLALLIASRVSAPLGRVVRETAAIADLRLDGEALPTTQIRELDQLSHAVEEMKTGLRSFRKYVPADLVRSIITSGQVAELGGQRREITMYFSDIAGFTSLSEQLDSDQLVSMLSQYLDAMTREMLKAGGTVDKYIGDAIVAFWNAPEDNPDHAATACRTALACQQALRELRERFAGQGLPGVHARIGLNTGDVMVGNFGCERRLDYTAIGDAMNLASRLEGINKLYGTEIIMGDATYRATRDQFVTRTLDRVAVKGKAQGLVIHELVGYAGQVDDATLARIARYEGGFEAYLARDWGVASSAFEAVLADRPEDTAAALMLDRVNGYLVTPPPKRWSGVYRATSK